MKYKKDKREPTKDGLLIRTIRTELNMTQREFAEAIGATQSTICNWETFRVPKVHDYWWKTIKEELGIDVEELRNG